MALTDILRVRVTPGRPQNAPVRDQLQGSVDIFTSFPERRRNSSMATGYGYAEEFGRSTSRENSVSRRGMKELSFTLSSLKSTILRNPLKAGIRLGDYN